MNKKFKLEQTLTGKITGDGECGRFLTDDGELLYIEDVFIPSTYDAYESKYEHLYRKKNPEWHNHHEASPRVKIIVNVEIEVLEDES